MKKLLIKCRCKIGWHCWQSQSDSFAGDMSGRVTTLVWWYCVDCHETKLKFAYQD